LEEERELLEKESVCSDVILNLFQNLFAGEVWRIVIASHLNGVAIQNGKVVL